MIVIRIFIPIGENPNSPKAIFSIFPVINIFTLHGRSKKFLPLLECYCKELSNQGQHISVRPWRAEILITGKTALEEFGFSALEDFCPRRRVILNRIVPIFLVRIIMYTYVTFILVNVYGLVLKKPDYKSIILIVSNLKTQNLVHS